MKDRQRGTLIGLVVGDALGAAVEFKQPGSFPEVTDYRGGGPHGLNAGDWTDDTSLALALTDHDAYEEGYDAYWEGVDISDNPYDKKTDAVERKSWEAGWREARKHDYDESKG